MIPTLPNLDGYIEVDGKQLRTPLQQIEKNKDDIKKNQDAIVELGKTMIILPAAPETPMILAIDSEGNLFLREYSNKAVGNSIVQRTGGGGAKFVAQYGSAENVANLAALQMAQSMAYIDSYSGSTISYKYKPYAFAAKGWGQGSSVENAEITDFPNAIGDEWYQKICNGADVDKTIILRSALMTNASRKTTQNCVQKFTNNVRFGNQEWEPGLHDLTLVVSSNSTIEIRCRYQPTGYSQIWIQ